MGPATAPVHTALEMHTNWPMSRVQICLLVLILVCAVPCLADDFQFSGNFGSLGLDPQFDAYLGEFVLPFTADVTIQSSGWADGGFDPIVSLFQGTGPSAVFLDLNDDAIPGVDLDSLLVLPGLSAGDYTLAVTYASNAPNAFFYGGGTLGDGFDGLGFQDLTRSDYFQVDVTFVPEPRTVVLFGSMLLVLAGIGGLRKRRLGSGVR